MPFYLAWWFVILGAVFPICGQSSRVKCSNEALDRAVGILRSEGSVLGDLLNIARSNNVCLGVEISPASLTPTQLRIRGQLPLTQLLETIKRQVHGATIEIDNGGVVVLRIDHSGTRWLDQIIPEFRTPKTSVQATSVQLWVLVSKKQGGSLGSFMSNPEETIGPLYVKNKSVMQILNIITGESGSGMWVADVSWTPSEDSRRPWIIVDYRQPFTDAESLVDDFARNLYAEAGKR